MSIDASIISYAVKYEDLVGLQQQGVSVDHFVDEFQTVWRYLLRTKRDHDTLPSPDTLKARFPDLDLPRVLKRELPLLLSQLRQRKKYIDFLTALNQAAADATSYESVDEVVQSLQGTLNTISFSAKQQSHLVDLFSPQVSKIMRKEVARRRSGQVVGIPTGLKRFDTITGGLQKQEMVTVIGRSGIGKSWIDLVFAAEAVISGSKVILYPLEMTLFQTAARLYTVFTQKMFGVENVLKNYDITSGNVSNRQLVRFLNALEDKFAGQLYVADVASLADPYTNERIEAEVEIHKPDMFWVDYITLLKPPTGNKNDAEHVLVKKLSNGIKNTAMRRNCVGGASAQVNREALRVRAFLPRLEHIAYGDSIGQDSDKVFSLNRKDGDLYWALVKNRGGMEIGKTRTRFLPDQGVLEEHEDQPEGDDD